MARSYPLAKLPNWVNRLKPESPMQSSSSTPERDGLKLLTLMLTSRTWVHRRVSALRLDTEGTTRQSVSVDITLPSDLAIEAEATSKRVVVPLGMLAKGAKQRLDAKHDGKGVAVLGRQQNSRMATDMLYAAVQRLPRKGEQDLPTDLAVLSRVVEASPEEAQSAFDAYEAWKRTSLDADRFQVRDRGLLVFVDLLIERLARNFLFLVELDADLVAIRTTLKYSLDQDLPELEGRGPQQIVFKYSIPDFGYAASQHVEVEVPRGLCLRTIDFVEFDRRGIAAQSIGYTAPNPTRLAHAVLAPKAITHTGDAWVEAVPSKQGLYSFSLWASIITVVLVLASIGLRVFNLEVLREERLIPSPAASIILVTPALLLSWLSKEPEHELVARLLAPLRHVLLACGGILLTMAVLAAVPFTPVVWHMLWFVVYEATACMALYAATVFAGYRLKSDPTISVEPKKGDPDESGT